MSSNTAVSAVIVVNVPAALVVPPIDILLIDPPVVPGAIVTVLVIPVGLMLMLAVGVNVTAPVADNVVNAPVLGVILPTIPSRPPTN